MRREELDEGRFAGSGESLLQPVLGAGQHFAVFVRPLLAGRNAGTNGSCRAWMIRASSSREMRRQVANLALQRGSGGIGHQIQAQRVVVAGNTCGRADGGTGHAVDQLASRVPVVGKTLVDGRLEQRNLQAAESVLMTSGRSGEAKRPRR